MTLESIIDQSVFGSIATVIGEASIENVYSILEFNRSVLSRFKWHVIALNKLNNVSDDIMLRYKQICLESLPNAIFLEHTENRGHVWGTIDLEESILRYVKENIPQAIYLWKSMEDVLIGEGIFTREYSTADFYYLPGFSYESLLLFNNSDKSQYREYFKSSVRHPQTTFFIGDISSIDSLYGDGILDHYTSYNKTKEANPYIKPWEVQSNQIEKFDCEHLIGKTFSHMTKECLITDEEFDKLIQMVYTNKIGDPSHKNIMFEKIRICHYHFSVHGVHII